VWEGDLSDTAENGCVAQLLDPYIQHNDSFRAANQPLLLDRRSTKPKFDIQIGFFSGSRSERKESGLSAIEGVEALGVAINQ